jgi:predicted metal-dependent peptidase
VSPAAGPGVLDEVSRTILDLVLDSPFFGHVAGGLGRTIGPGLRQPLALRVDGPRFTLVASPTRFPALTRAQRAVALEHELLHAVLAHPVRAVDHADSIELFVAACDLVVNQLLTTGPPLPGAFTLAALPRHERVPDLTAEGYLAVLRRLYTDGARPGTGCCGGGGDPWGLRTRDGTGGAGAGAGAGAAQLAWAGFEPVLLAAAGRVSARTWGRLPGRLRSHIEALRAARAGTLDWRRVLRMFAASSRRSRIRGTLRRESRRYHAFPGIRVTRGQRMAVCVDTSGSIDDEVLADFFAEIHHLWRAGAEIMVLEVDARLHRTWRYVGTPPSEVAGRGGTSFDPGLRAVREAMPSYDACVYLTDGYAPQPTERPGVPLLWLVTPNGSTGDHLMPGTVVPMR